MEHTQGLRAKLPHPSDISSIPNEYPSCALQRHGPTLDQRGDENCNIAKDDEPPESSDHGLPADESGVE